MTALSTMDLGLSMMDRQLVASDGSPVGKVDDLEFVDDGAGAPVLANVLCGPLAMGPRLGGRLGTWWVAVARRLRLESTPTAASISTSVILRIGPEIDLALPSKDLGQTQRLEKWLHDKVIRPLPGA